ncbi:MAG: hypothetical protein PHC62_01740 [Candidatus Izemoplasmatales bacterium]|jgi:hypothetical protein|nr:hypothetical protein [Candidatus Izemoplasmatales bacterium]
MNKPLNIVLEAFKPVITEYPYKHKHHRHSSVGEELQLIFQVDLVHVLNIQFFAYEKEKSINVIYSFETTQNKILKSKVSYPVSSALHNKTLPGLPSESIEKIKKHYNYSLEEGIIRNNQDLEQAATELSDIFVKHLDALYKACAI